MRQLLTNFTSREIMKNGILNGKRTYRKTHFKNSEKLQNREDKCIQINIQRIVDSRKWKDISEVRKDIEQKSNEKLRY